MGTSERVVASVQQVCSILSGRRGHFGFLAAWISFLIANLPGKRMEARPPLNQLLRSVIGVRAFR
jgi:hypothetical protein